MHFIEIVQKTDAPHAGSLAYVSKLCAASAALVGGGKMGGWGDLSVFWQCSLIKPCGNLAQNIAYVSAFIHTYPHMKFQVDIYSGSKILRGTDRQTTRFLNIHAGCKKNNVSLKKMLKYVIEKCLIYLTKF